MRRPKWIVFFDTFWTRDTPFETTIENENEGEMEKKMEEFEERPSSRARREGQDLHHLTVVSRCLVCRWSLRGRWNNIAFSSSWHAGCNGRTAPRRRNCAPSRLVFAASRTAWRTAIPRPSRRTGTAIHDFVCVCLCVFFFGFWFVSFSPPMRGRGPAEQAQQYQQMIQKNDRTTSSIPCNSSRVPGRFLVVNAGRHELWSWVVSNFYLQDGLTVMGLGWNYSIGKKIL